MASLNKVILLGNLTKDPEFKHSPSGVAVAKLRIAVNEQFRDRASGQLKEVACYVDVMVWDRQAEACGQFLMKGSQVIVDGRLTYDEWKTPQGEMRSRLAVRADRVQFLGNTRKTGPDGQVPSGPVPAAPVQQASPAVPAYAPAPQPAPAANPVAQQQPANGDDENLPF